MAIELVKENIECEQLLGENTIDTVVKSEYLIPDTHPDVKEILSLEAKPYVMNKEVLQDKVFLEGQIEYNVLYLAADGDKYAVHNVNYSSKFSDYVEIKGSEHAMACEGECYVEHMDCGIINERKVSIEGIIKLKAEVYNNQNFEVIKDVIGAGDIQFLRNPSSVDKIMGSLNADLVAKSHIQISSDKPEIGNILKCDVNVHKKEVKVEDRKVNISAFASINILYRGKDSNEICNVQDDVFINKELEVENALDVMDNFTVFTVDAQQFDIKEDDLGENRIIDTEVLIKAAVKIMHKEEMNVIEDAYSPSIILEMNKKNYEVNVIQGQSLNQTIVKGNLEVGENNPKPKEVINCNGSAVVTDKKIVEDKVVVEGIVDTSVLYKTDIPEKYIQVAQDSIPFTCTLDIPQAKIDMQCVARVNLESIEAFVEADTIAVKAVVEVYSRVNYNTNREFLVNIEPVEGEMPKKKGSITIYVVQNGDSLWKVAKKYFCTVDSLIGINELENPEELKPGQKLIIPGRAAI